MDLAGLYEDMQSAVHKRTEALHMPVPDDPKQRAERDVTLAVAEMRVKDRRAAYENAVQDEARRRFQAERRGG